MAQVAIGRLVEIIDNLEWPDPKASEGPVIESQVAVLRAIARQPGSVILYEDPARAGTKPIRFRTIRRLVELGDLEIHQSDQSQKLYLVLSNEGWDRITKVDKE